MGLGQSSEKEKNSSPISSKFSTVELKKLEEYFKFKDQAPESKQWNQEFVKERIGASFNQEIGGKVMRYLERDIKGSENDETFLELAFHLTKDCINDLASIVFKIIAEGDEIVTRDSMKKFLTGFLTSYLHGTPYTVTTFVSDQQSSERLAEKLIEHCPEKMRAEDFDVVLHRTPLLIDVLQYKFRMLFYGYISEVSKDMQGTMPFLIPNLEIDKSASQDSFVLSLASTIYLNSRLPMDQQHKWRLLYSTKLHGESFSKLTGAIIDKGPTLLVIRDTNGYTFGGYASTSWQYSSQFQGTHKCLLFTVEPLLNVYDCLGGSYNDHYMYLNIGQETMPNGLGMGGQFEFFGLWLDGEFGLGHSKAKPLCTTYKSPQLSKDEHFKIDSVTVWGTGEEPRKVDNDEFNEEMTSVLDKHVEAKALLEIAGKPRVSEGFRDVEPDADIPETKELQQAHDPMT